MQLSNKLNQEATYWASTGATDLYGKPVFSAPVKIKCRWEDANELFQSKGGEERTSKAKVFAITEMDIDGWLAPGNQTSQANPHNADKAWEIQGISTFPDLRNLQQLTVAFL